MTWLQWALSGSILGLTLSVNAIVRPIIVAPILNVAGSTSTSTLLLPTVSSSTTSPGISTISSTPTQTATSTFVSVRTVILEPVPIDASSSSTSATSTSNDSFTALTMATAVASLPSCSVCAYSVLGTTITYSDQSAIFSSIDVTATRLTFTYLYPDGSSSIGYSLVANYTPTANITVPFTTPTQFGSFSTPPTWIFSGQTLTAGTTYEYITEIMATSYGISMIPVKTAPAVRRAVAVQTSSITSAPIPASTGVCSYTSTSETFTDVPVYADTDLAGSSSALFVALSEFYGNSAIQSAFGIDPSCTPVSDLTNLLPKPTTTKRPGIVPQIVPHLSIQPAVVPAVVPAATVVDTQAPVTYVTANVLTSNGPGTVIKVAPTGDGDGVATVADVTPTKPPTHQQNGGLPVPKQISPNQPTNVAANDPPANDPTANAATANAPTANGPRVTDTAGNTPAGSNSVAANPAQPVADNEPVPSGATFRQGAAANGQTITNAQAQIVPQAQATPTPVIVGGQTVVPVGGGSVAVAGKTLAPGAVTTLANGVPISVGTDGSKVVVGTQTANLVNPVAPSPVVLPGGSTVTPAPGGNGIVVNGQTITAGETGTLANGQPVSVGPGGSVVVVQGQTYTLPPQPTAGVVVNGETITPVASGIVVGGTTLTPGQVVTLPDSQVISVGSSGIVAVGQSTVQIATNAMTTSSLLITTSQPSPSYTVGPTTTSKSKVGSATSLFKSFNTSLIHFTLVVGLMGFLIGI